MLINVEDLTEEQAKKVAINILGQLNNFLKEEIEENPIFTLEVLTDWMDELNTEDFFGTEGWKHLFGFEE